MKHENKICNFVPNKQISNVEQFHNYTQPYSQLKSSVKLYRFVFFAIGVLYLYLSVLLFTKTVTWTTHLLFGNGTNIQSILCGFCALTAVFFLGLGFFLKIEREAVRKTFKKANMRLEKLYRRKVIQARLFNFFAFGEEYEKSTILKHFYCEARDNLSRLKEKTIDQLLHIARAEELSSEEREALYNEIIVDLKKKMRGVIHQFDISYSL